MFQLFFIFICILHGLVHIKIVKKNQEEEDR